MLRSRAGFLVVGALIALAACGLQADPPGGGSGRSAPTATAGSRGNTLGIASQPPPHTTEAGLPGMPPMDPRDVYAAGRPGLLSPAVRGFRSLVYVPISGSDTVEVIDPRSYRVVGRYRGGRNPQHVTPSWDLRTLWSNNNKGNSLTAFDPRTGKPVRTVPVADPYNLYFTPDGRYALVMASQLRRIDWRDPRTMRLRHSLPVPCAGVNHADFSADGRYFIASCEFSNELIKVDTARMTLLGVLGLPARDMPQDVKLAPDGKVFYVADMMADGVWLVDGARFRVTGFLRTGQGAHGLYVTRDSRYLVVTNRGEGSLSLIDLATRTVAKKWRIPGGGSPDMGGISADGKVFWVSGRYDAVVYAISLVDGRLIRKIRVGPRPHGLCVYPQPGRYSLGHTGVFR